MEIGRYTSNLLQSNMYVLCEDGDALVIDPFASDLPLAGINAVPSLVILTHEHFDHISGVNFYREKFGVPVCASAVCAENLKKPNRNLSRHFDAFCQMQSWLPGYVCEHSGDYICSADETFSGSEEFIWRGHRIRLTEAPGHSAGSIFIHIDGEYLFAGDSIFKDYPTGTRFTGGSSKDFDRITRPLINTFPRGTMVYPGHFAPFKIEERYTGDE